MCSSRSTSLSHKPSEGLEAEIRLKSTDESCFFFSRGDSRTNPKGDTVTTSLAKRRERGMGRRIEKYF